VPYDTPLEHTDHTVDRPRPVDDEAVAAGAVDEPNTEPDTRIDERGHQPVAARPLPHLLRTTRCTGDMTASGGRRHPVERPGVLAAAVDQPDTARWFMRRLVV
jgi:hypothetical protein